MPRLHWVRWGQGGWDWTVVAGSTLAPPGLGSQSRLISGGLRALCWIRPARGGREHLQSLFSRLGLSSVDIWSDILLGNWDFLEEWTGPVLFLQRDHCVQHREMDTCNGGLLSLLTISEWITPLTFQQASCRASPPAPTCRPPCPSTVCWTSGSRGTRRPGSRACQTEGRQRSPQEPRRLPKTPAWPQSWNKRWCYLLFLSGWSIRSVVIWSNTESMFNYWDVNVDMTRLATLRSSVLFNPLYYWYNTVLWMTNTMLCDRLQVLLTVDQPALNSFILFLIWTPVNTFSTNFV